MFIDFLPQLKSKRVIVLVRRETVHFWCPKLMSNREPCMPSHEAVLLQLAPNLPKSLEDQKQPHPDAC